MNLVSMLPLDATDDRFAVKDLRVAEGIRLHATEAIGRVVSPAGMIHAPGEWASHSLPGDQQNRSFKEQTK